MSQPSKRQQRIQAAREAALRDLSAIHFRASREIDWPEGTDNNDKAAALRGLREEGKILMQGNRRGARYILQGDSVSEEAPTRPPETSDDPLLDFLTALPDGLQGQRQAPLVSDLIEQWAERSRQDHRAATKDIQEAVRAGLLQTERRQFWPDSEDNPVEFRAVGRVFYAAARGELVGHHLVAWPA